MNVIRKIHGRRVSVGSVPPLSNFCYEGHTYVWGRCQGMGDYARVVSENVATGAVKLFELTETVEFFELADGDTVIA